MEREEPYRLGNSASRELMTHLITVRAQTIDLSSRSIQATLSTETPVTVFDWSAGLIDEVLLADGGRFPAQLPLLDSHDRSTLQAVMGSIKEIQRSGNNWVGRLYFAQGVPAADAAWELVRGGHLTDVSIGYLENDFTDIGPGQTGTVNGKTYTASPTRALRITKSYTPREASLVPIGADPGAKIRSEFVTAGEPLSRGSVVVLAPRQNIQKINEIAGGMMLRAGLKIKDKSIVDAARKYASHRLPEICREAISLDERRECTVGERDAGQLVDRALSGGSLTNIFTNFVNAAVMSAWDEEPDTTIGWTKERDVQTFKEILPVGVSVDAVLRRLAPGQAAEHAYVSDWGEPYSLMRLARQFEVDEMDLIDDRLDAFLDLPNQFGVAARRARADLVYSLMLANPALNRDGKTLFHADHKNYGSSGTAFSNETLAAGIAALENQVNPRTKDLIPYGLRAAYLITPPDLKTAALNAVRQITIPNSDGEVEQLTVLSDSRIGSAGVVSPMDGVKRTGTATNWFLAARAGKTIEVAFLSSTNRLPQVRGYPLDNGKWGVGWDITFDIGAQIVDYPGFYKADGTT